jgi:hypothetical protein
MIANFRTMKMNVETRTRNVISTLKLKCSYEECVALYWRLTN